MSTVTFRGAPDERTAATKRIEVCLERKEVLLAKLKRLLKEHKNLTDEEAENHIAEHFTRFHDARNCDGCNAEHPSLAELRKELTECTSDLVYYRSQNDRLNAPQRAAPTAYMSKRAHQPAAPPR